MNRYIKVMLIIIGWVVVFGLAVLLVSPIALSFQDPVLQDTPLHMIFPSLVMSIGIALPIMYGVSFLITPLLMATIEIFDNEVN